MGRKRNGTLTSGQLGASAGVSADSIRHYEKLGLLAKPVRTAGGYRLFPSSALPRVQTIRSALKAGFSLKELVGIFRERDAGGTPCRRVASMASGKIAALERQIAELTELRNWLSTTVANWNARLERTPSGKRAGLLESLALQDLSANRQSKGSNHEANRSRVTFRSEPRRIGPDRHERPHARPAGDF
jgi:DNA-binding transcriptional MerR regulator